MNALCLSYAEVHLLNDKLSVLSLQQWIIARQAVHLQPIETLVEDLTSPITHRREDRVSTE